MIRPRRFAPLASALLALAACDRPASTSAPATAPSPPSPQAAALLAELPPAYQHADLENGRLHFTLCRSCHVALKGGADMVGPNLFGVFGRKAGSKPGYAYSDAVKALGWTWDADHLDTWLKDPRAVAPGTKMSFAGIRDDADRRDLIAYLRVATSGAEP